MMYQKHKVFISYNHANDQWAKEYLLKLNNWFDIFIDGSVDIGEISDSLSDQAIRKIIRDEYLRDSSVTILLVGTQTKYRKHILWELYSSMLDGAINKKSGLLIVELPSVSSRSYHVSRPQEKSVLFPETKSWRSILNRTEFEELYPYQPDLVIDNLIYGKGRFSIIPWAKIENNPEALRLLIEGAFLDRKYADYDLSRPMRERNFNALTPARGLLGHEASYGHSLLNFGRGEFR